MLWPDSPPRPRGVKEGALAACVESVAFLLEVLCVAGVKEGDSTFSVFLDLEAEGLLANLSCGHPTGAGMK